MGMSQVSKISWPLTLKNFGFHITYICKDKKYCVLILEYLSRNKNPLEPIIGICKVLWAVLNAYVVKEEHC